MARKRELAEDSEPLVPKLKRRVYLKVNRLVWFIDTDARWYLMVVTALPSRLRVVLRPQTGRDSTGEREWPYALEMEYPLYMRDFTERLRPLSARNP